MKFYKVTAKCGHVGGTHKYIPIDFYTRAENASQAASIVRRLPRVKHHQKDAILSMCEISYEEYKLGTLSMQSDPYFLCKSKQQQALYSEQIDYRVCDEENGKYRPWDDKYKYKNKSGETRHNRKKSLRYGYRNAYLLQTQGSFNYRDYLIDESTEGLVA